jgi:23S rRNA (cytosine1962-C5)-methyltransferase
MIEKVIIKKGKEEAILRRHNWIFSGAIQSNIAQLVNGTLVKVFDFKDRFLAVGYFQDGSIAVRILSFEDVPIDLDYWKSMILKAYTLRKNLQLIDNSATNCYRLMHGEGDGVSGLVVDVYDKTIVIQCHTTGILLQRTLITEALTAIYGKKYTIVDKSRETISNSEGNIAFEFNQVLYKGAEKTKEIVLENGLKFKIDWETGQKTGFFIDQRENRKLLQNYVKDKKVLNTFCYTGGFSMYALEAGAQSVVSIDISKKAVDLAVENATINFGEKSEHEGICADVMHYLKDNKAAFDVIIVDPPAFAKNISKRHNAVQAYKRLNQLAISQVAAQGFIFTFSCSQVIDRQLFNNTIYSAALESGRNVKIIQQLSQASDHPINIFHQETAYLKGLLLYVE